MRTKTVVATALLCAGCTSEDVEVNTPAPTTELVAHRPEEPLIPSDAGLCPVDLPTETVTIRRYNETLIVTVAAGDPSLVETLRRRAREIGESGYYEPASAFQDPGERGDGELELNWRVRVRVNQEDLEDGIRIVLETQDKEDADKLERQLEIDQGLLHAGRCEPVLSEPVV